MDATEVPIEQVEDLLSPLLIVKFLNTLAAIVRKGLKKSYYKKQQNLNSRIKGKILVSQNIKQNILKNKFTSTFCQFEEFGINSLENRLLKKHWYLQQYIDNHQKII
ncbi:MAG: hypothetical protein IPP48_10150 [Chitinophagaceae bacterium]|nr:hypothetical protein [Chitinophagaceae bacterium]